jgi:hypothetical protein
MNTTLKKLAAAAIVAAPAPALLFAGAGTAQAAPSVTYNNNAFGTIANVSDPLNPAGSIEICHYSSHVAGSPLLFPYYTPVQLSGSTPSSVQIFGIQTGTTYTVTVKCPKGGTTTFNQTF